MAASIFASCRDEFVLNLDVQRAHRCRLQRSSTWRDNLEGWLAYLNGVVLDDSLGIAAELEAQMQLVVDSDACAWKAAVNNPETRKRFGSFVNSDRPDGHVVFVQERCQIRAARPGERPATPAAAAALA